VAVHMKKTSTIMYIKGLDAC